MMDEPFPCSGPNSITTPSTTEAKLSPRSRPQSQRRALRGGGGRGQQRQPGLPLLVAGALGPPPRAAQDRAADRGRGRRQAQVQEGQAGTIQVRRMRFVLRLRGFVGHFSENFRKIGANGSIYSILKVFNIISLKTQTYAHRQKMLIRFSTTEGSAIVMTETLSRAISNL